MILRDRILAWFMIFTWAVILFWIGSTWWWIVIGMFVVGDVLWRRRKA